jgi:sugar-specific transcriptional regulator TrmB
VNSQKILRALENLGFTRVEAEVYAYLVGNSPATGYQIAKAIGRTRGAAYSVLESLASKGAVVVEIGDTHLWRAVPAREFLEVLERRFLAGKREAADALRHVDAAPPDNLVYQLKTIEQVYERARTLMRSSRRAVLIDVDPEPYEMIRADIVGAVRRKIKVALICPEAVNLPGARASVYFPGYKILTRFPARQMVVAADGREFLISSLSKDGRRVIQACWSASPFLSWVVWTYLKMNILAEEFVTLLETGAPISKVRASYRSYFKHLPAYSSPGSRELAKLFEGE